MMVGSKVLSVMVLLHIMSLRGAHLHFATKQSPHSWRLLRAGEHRPRNDMSRSSHFQIPQHQPIDLRDDLFIAKASAADRACRTSRHARAAALT